MSRNTGDSENGKSGENRQRAKIEMRLQEALKLHAHSNGEE